MKSSNFILPLAVFALMATIPACDKGDDTKLANINFPAAYVVNGKSNDIDVINLNDGTHDNHFSLDGATYPHHVYFNPDKSLMAVAITATDLSSGHAGHGGGTGDYKVLVINATTGEIHHEIATEHLPHNAIFSPDGSELWVAQAAEPLSHIAVFKTSDFSSLAEIEVGKGLSEVTFAVNGSKAYAANTEDGTVSVIDPATKTVTATITVGEDPVGAWAADNGKMYVDNETSKTVMEIDVATDAITATIDLGYKPGYVAYSDHHAELWVSDATNGKVVYYKLVGGVWTKEGEISTGADAHAIAFNADGTKAYVTNQGAATVSVVQLSDHTKLDDITVGEKPNGIVLKQ